MYINESNKTVIIQKNIQSAVIIFLLHGAAVRDLLNFFPQVRQVTKMDPFHQSVVLL